MTIGRTTRREGLRIVVAAAAALALAAPAARAQSAAEIQGALDAAYAKYKDLKEGKNADYIPALAKVDSSIYGIALVTTDGKVYTAGDVKSESNPMQATDVYTEQCSVNVNAKDLATMAGTLANGGKNPLSGKQVMKTANVAPVLAVMATAGLYDDSGKWFYHTGLPGKSGVGGGIIAVSPGKFGVAVVSPPLDEAGNSVKAQKAIADISNALGGNPLASKPR